MKKWLYIVLAALVLFGCKKEEPQPPSLIMEGWIDANGHPVVMIHKTYVLDFGNDKSRTIEETIEDLLIPFGKVTVSDGEQEVVLTGRIDTAYLPPYTYNSTYIRGQVGKTYTFTAKYYDYYATATTTIPPVATIDSLIIRTENDKLDVRAYMPVVEDGYYAFFLRKPGSPQYILCPFDVFEGRDAVNGRMEVKVYCPFTDTENEFMGIDFQFRNDPKKTDTDKTYRLKVARIDEEAYRFWKAYNELAITKGILFVPVYKNIPSNVVGGYGNVSGMGASFYDILLARDTTYRF